jgi:hypothetical protein
VVFESHWFWPHPHSKAIMGNPSVGEQDWLSPASPRAFIGLTPFCFSRRKNGNWSFVGNDYQVRGKYRKKIIHRNVIQKKAWSPKSLSMLPNTAILMWGHWCDWCDITDVMSKMCDLKPVPHQIPQMQGSGIAPSQYVWAESKSKWKPLANIPPLFSSHLHHHHPLGGHCMHSWVQTTKFTCSALPTSLILQKTLLVTSQSKKPTLQQPAEPSTGPCRPWKIDVVPEGGGDVGWHVSLASWTSYSVKGYTEKNPVSLP